MNTQNLKDLLKEKIGEEFYAMKAMFPNWDEEINWNDITANVYTFSPNQVLKMLEEVALEVIENERKEILEKIEEVWNNRTFVTLNDLKHQATEKAYRLGYENCYKKIKQHLPQPWEKDNEK